MGRSDTTTDRRPGRRPAWGLVVTFVAALVVVGGVGGLGGDAAFGQPANPRGLTPELPDLLDRPAPVAAAAVDIPTTVAIVQRNADLGLERLDALLDDPAAWVDHDGRIFIVEPARHHDDHGEETDDDAPSFGHGAAAQSSGTGDPVLADTYPHSMAFELESRPGSSRVIYLDFDGATISGTGWNANFTGGADFSAEPYDADGSPSTFSDAERAVIQSVWRRVAEDFAPFDVNVTTRDPGLAAIERNGSADQEFGTRVLISNTTAIYSSCGCGGVAYIGVFDRTIAHSYHQPAWVFQRGTGSGAKGIAEAVSHETGHILGLFHDGTGSSDYYGGQGAWAPIMGVGYNRPLTQWSRGEYSGANNTEDDHAVMQANGLALLPDDHGDAPGDASALVAGSVDVTGVVSTPADVDVFEISTSGGTVSLTANPAAVSPNLDIALELLDEGGAVVAAADPPSARTNADVAAGVAASITVDVPAGVYHLRLGGTGAGDPLLTGYSDYGSLGRYRLTGTFPAALPPPPTPPTAVVDATPTSGTAPLTVILDGSASGDADGIVVDHAWDLGDGTTTGGAVVNHTYTEVGEFTASLTVTDDDGLTATASTTITVGPSPEPEPDPEPDPEPRIDPDPDPDPDPAVDVVDVRLDGTTARTGARARAIVRIADRNGGAAADTAVDGVLSLTALDGTTRTLARVTTTTDAAGALSVTGPLVADTLRNEVFSFCVVAVTPPVGTIHEPDLSAAPTCATWVHDRTPVYCRGVLATIVGSGTIRATSGDDVVVGGRGPDLIRGRGGDDLICAGGGNDVVGGNGGEDRLFGQGGRDRLVGGAKRDRLVGGPLRDTLISDRADVLVSAGGDRVIERRLRRSA